MRPQMDGVVVGSEVTRSALAIHSEVTWGCQCMRSPSSRKSPRPEVRPLCGPLSLATATEFARYARLSHSGPGVYALAMQS